MNLNKLLLTTTTVLGLLLSPFAVADSDLQFGGGATATANLDFRITIPQFVFFQIGTGGATVDRVDWDLTGSQPGQALSLAATGGTGDGVDGILNVTLITNAATIDITSNTSGGTLSDGTNTIPFSEIAVVGGGTIPVPGFDTSTGAFATGGTYNATDTWTYTYNDGSSYAPGVYDGGSIYTAATP